MGYIAIGITPTLSTNTLYCSRITTIATESWCQALSVYIASGSYIQILRCHRFNFVLSCKTDYNIKHHKNISLSSDFSAIKTTHQNCFIVAYEKWSSQRRPGRPKRFICTLYNIYRRNLLYIVEIYDFNSLQSPTSATPHQVASCRRVRLPLGNLVSTITSSLHATCTYIPSVETYVKSNPWHV